MNVLDEKLEPPPQQTDILQCMQKRNARSVGLNIEQNNNMRQNAEIGEQILPQNFSKLCQHSNQHKTKKKTKVAASFT